jgi:hypothetical protein
MHTNSSRRQFLKRATLGAGALSALQFAPNLLRAAGANEKLNLVQIGCGGRGMYHLSQTVDENVVAIVEVHEKQHGVAKKWLESKNKDVDKLQVFTDYRKMFDKIGKEIDAVFIATPNHQHALPAMIAMQLGKNVYCEKPVCHDIAEARHFHQVHSLRPGHRQRFGERFDPQLAAIGTNYTDFAGTDLSVDSHERIARWRRTRGKRATQVALTG